MGIAEHRWESPSTLNVSDYAYNGIRAEGYFIDVIRPALHTLRSQIEELERKQEGAWPFIVDHLQVIEKATVEAFILALQSIWERQLRIHLSHFRSLDVSADKLEKATWLDLQKYFHTWRGISLDAFDSFHWLDLLQELGSACRHGDGRAARSLFERHPELWPNWPLEYIASGDEVKPLPPEGPPSFRDIVIPEHWLKQFADAIVWFWEDIEYIYMQSITRKHESVYTKLSAMESAWPTRAKAISSTRV
jgi:hypothetical protein